MILPSNIHKSDLCIFQSLQEDDIEVEIENIVNDTENPCFICSCLFFRL